MVPKGWATFELAECANFKSGNTPSKSDKSYWGYKWLWVSAKDLKSHYIVDSEQKLTDKGLAQASVAPKNAVLVLTRGMGLLKDIPVGITTIQTAFNQDVKALIPKDFINPLFLSYLLVGYKPKIRNLVDVAGHGTGRLDTGLLKSLHVDVPPLPEQKKIARILSTWDAAIKTVEKLIENSQRQEKALEQLLLTGKKRLSGFTEEWKTKKLSDVCQVRGGKRIPKGRSLTHINTGHPYIRVTDMKMGSVNKENILYVPDEVFPLIKEYRIYEGDLFITVAGTLGIVGKIDGDFDGANLTENADRITNISINVDYLHAILQSPIIQKHIEAEKTTNAQPKLALTRIRDFKIPIPPLEEQKKIAHLFLIWNHGIQVLENELELLRNQKKALMQQLLAGKRRVNVDE